MQEFATTKLTTRQTYTLAFIEGSLDANPITFKARLPRASFVGARHVLSAAMRVCPLQEQDGMDFAATTVKLPDGEYVPFLFTVKVPILFGVRSAKGSASRWSFAGVGCQG